jgi:hypothetical protein
LINKKSYNSFKSETLYALRGYNSTSQHRKQGTVIELFIQ